LYGLRTRVVRGFLPLELYIQWIGVVRDDAIPLRNSDRSCLVFGSFFIN
jgi:hypothetical protein